MKVIVDHQVDIITNSSSEIFIINREDFKEVIMRSIESAEFDSCITSPYVLKKVERIGEYPEEPIEWVLESIAWKMGPPTFTEESIISSYEKVFGREEIVGIIGDFRELARSKGVDISDVWRHSEDSFLKELVHKYDLYSKIKDWYYLDIEDYNRGIIEEFKDYLEEKRSFINYPEH